jgi:hypothetical protein
MFVGYPTGARALSPAVTQPSDRCNQGNDCQDYENNLLKHRRINVESHRTTYYLSLHSKINKS